MSISTRKGGGDGIPLHFDSQFDPTRSVGVAGEDILAVSVVADGQSLGISVGDFQAGDKRAFTIDVEHAVGLNDAPIATFSATPAW